jgi:hypothetical protein
MQQAHAVFRAIYRPRGNRRRAPCWRRAPSGPTAFRRSLIGGGMAIAGTAFRTPAYIWPDQ